MLVRDFLSRCAVFSRKRANAKEAMGEANVPAEQPQAVEASRFPSPDVEPGGQGDSPSSARQGPPPAVRLSAGRSSNETVWRLRGRSNFTRLRNEGRRVRRGPITVTYVTTPSSGNPPRVGYAIGRHVGSAVTRNRLRRRLREIVREHPPVSGDYLLSAAPPAAKMTFPQLRGVVSDALRLTAER